MNLCTWTDSLTRHAIIFFFKNARISMCSSAYWWLMFFLPNFLLIKWVPLKKPDLIQWAWTGPAYYWPTSSWSRKKSAGLALELLHSSGPSQRKPGLSVHAHHFSTHVPLCQHQNKQNTNILKNKSSVNWQLTEWRGILKLTTATWFDGKRWQVKRGNEEKTVKIWCLALSILSV